MSKFRRMLMMANTVEPVPPTPVLPYDAEVEYLRSSGGAYIDTGLKANTEYKVECKFRVNVSSNTNNVAVFGFYQYVKNSSDAGLCIYWRKASSNFYYQYKKVSTFGQAGTGAGSWHTVTLDNTVITFDGNTINGNANNYSNNTVKFLIFARGNNTASGGIEMKTDNSISVDVERIKISLNGNVLRDYISVRKDGVGYLYDKENDALYGNASDTGSFTYGNDVS